LLEGCLALPGKDEHLRAVIYNEKNWQIAKIFASIFCSFHGQKFFRSTGSLDSITQQNTAG
jgi:hypothetical protein